MLRSETWIVAVALALTALGARAEPSAETERLDERALDERLRVEARLDWIAQYARVRSPALAESSARARAASERASAAGRLPDAELKYEQWAVPLARPYSLGRSDTLMLGLRQAFPAAGTRRAREQVTVADAEIAAQQRRATERELIRRIRKAYFEYYAADQTLVLQREQIGVTEQMLAQLRGNYELGRGRQQDLLKAIVELSRLHNGIVDGAQQRDSSRFMLNTLMGRATDAQLGPPQLGREGVPEAVVASELAPHLSEGRPELAAARSVSRRAQAELEGARHTARRPGFMVGADYWLMPTEDSPHAYGAMVSMSLPWFNPEHRAQARAAEQSLRADRYAEVSAAQLASLELHQAVAGLAAAKASLAILEHELLPQAEQSLQATESAFSLGQSDMVSWLDAQRSFFEVRLERSRAFARVLSQLAEVEFASGLSLFPNTAREPTP